MKKLLAAALRWGDAHLDPASVFGRFTPETAALEIDGLPYTAWQLLEHMRRAQRDILEFCTSDQYVEMKWPDEYWPAAPGPPRPQDWHEAVASFFADNEKLQEMATDPTRDLQQPVPNGDGQTYLREILLVLDHNAYHLGQLVVLSRLTGSEG